MTTTVFPRRLRDRVQPEFSLSRLTTLRVGGPAQYFVRAECLRDVADTVQAAQDNGLPLHVLGGGSNLLIADEGVRGVVLCLHGMTQIKPFGRKVLVQAGAKLSALVARCSAAGIAGPQSLAGIPGTVGGALAMNAGGRYGEIADYVERVIWLSPQGELRSLYREEIEFGYRISDLRHGVAIEAVMEGVEGDRTKLITEARRVLDEKKSVQPYSEFSAGCAFKNPKDNSAGRFIDRAGCKGLTVGGATVSLMHGNFIVNRGDATARDVRQLMDIVQDRVRTAFGVELQPEIQIWPGNCLSAA